MDLDEREIHCPYCGEPIVVLIEYIGEPQEYIEDCQVCCCPIVFNIASSADEWPSVEVRAE